MDRGQRNGLGRGRLSYRPYGAKNQRAAARRTAVNAERRASREVSVSVAGELSGSRLEALTDIDPGWCLAWEIGWQRSD
ncbi:hypothetical protein ABIE67_009832 [Streptomyces sp. V4I8]|uniref:hypothetical protein n=1 Tax=Streptomyces sp. V4I8 TaxID=3156469 RepID=UPI003516EF7B